MRTERKAASVAIFNTKGELLFGLRQTEQLWTLPGGKLEPGENPEAGAIREAWEECGLKIENILYLGEGLVENSYGLWRIYAFRATASGTPHGRNDPDGECQVWRWVNVTQGIPPAIEDELYNPNNVTLRLLGLQAGEVVDGSVDTKVEEGPEETLDLHPTIYLARAALKSHHG